MSKKRYVDRGGPRESAPHGDRPPTVKEVSGWWVQLATTGEDDEDFMAMLKARPWAWAWYQNGAPLNSKYIGVEAQPLPETVERLTTAPSPFDFICTDGMLDAKAMTIMEPHWKGLDPATVQAICKNAKAAGEQLRPYEPAKCLGFEIGLDAAAAQAGAEWVCLAITDAGARYRQTYDEDLRQSILLAMVNEKTKAERERAARVYLSRVWDAGVVLFAERVAVVM